jgi:hypothetical protein
VVENTHEPIITQETWDIVQKLTASRRRESHSGEIQMFAGLVKCAGRLWCMKRKPLRMAGKPSGWISTISL